MEEMVVHPELIPFVLHRNRVVFGVDFCSHNLYNRLLINKIGKIFRFCGRNGKDSIFFGMCGEGRWKMGDGRRTEGFRIQDPSFRFQSSKFKVQGWSLAADLG
jgi:hypothetical protein